MNILAQSLTPAGNGTRAGRVILVKIEGYQPFVTGWQGRDEDTGIYDRSWCSGHYFATEAEAREDFASRMRRGY
jgi:hypothetical protein